MRKVITRNILSSEISAFKITVQDGKPTIDELPLITVIGKLNEKRALKEIQNKYGADHQYSIGKIEVKKNTYSINLDDFITIATKQEN